MFTEPSQITPPSETTSSPEPFSAVMEQSTPSDAPSAWSARDLLLYLATAVVAFMLTGLLMNVGYAMAARVGGWQAQPTKLAQNTFYLLAFQLIFYGFLLGYTYLLVVVNYRLPFWRGTGWRGLTKHHIIRYLLGGVLLGFLVLLAPPILPDSKDFPLERLFSSPAAAYALGIFAVIVAPFMEELVFRGVLFAFFEKNGGKSVAIIATALLFASLHVSEYWGAWNHVLLIVVVGLILSLTRGLTGSVTPCYILHLSYNATLIVQLFLQTDQFRQLRPILPS